MAICYLAKLYWEGCKALLVNLPNFVGKFIGKFVSVYWEGCQTLWVNGQTYLQDILSEDSVTSRYLLLINLWGFVMWPNFIRKVSKLYWEGCQHLLGRLPNFIGGVAKIY